MKLAVRVFALSLVVTGIAAGTMSPKSSAGVQVVPASAPMPVCPFNTGDCGLSKF